MPQFQPPGRAAAAHVPIPSALAILLALAAGARAQDFDKVEVRTEKVAGHLYMLRGAGGNMGLCTGVDGAFLIDDEFAPLTAKIQAAVASVTDKPIRFVLSTHWHDDHVGGNENLGKAGAVLVAHENVRERLAVDQILDYGTGKLDTTRALSHAGLPLVTFAHDIRFHVNGEEVHVFHVDDAHTDGDAVVHFEKANVVHTGDLFFADSYPYIDLAAGGSVDGMIAAADRILGMVDGSTKIIPGHGPLSDRAGLQAFRDMLAANRDRVRAAIAEGRTLEQVQAARLTAPFDAQWGGSKFMTPKLFVEILYRDLWRQVAAPGTRH